MKTWRHRLKLHHNPRWEESYKNNSCATGGGSGCSTNSVSVSSRIGCNVAGWLPGWYMVELDIRHELPFAQVSLSFDSEPGVAPAAKINLRQGKLAKRLVYIPAKVRTLYLDPPAKGDCLVLHYCRFVWVTRRFASDRKLRRLIAVHPRFKGQDKKSVLLALKREASARGRDWKEWLNACYESTFGHFVAGRDYDVWLDRVEQQSSHVPTAGQAEPEALAYTASIGLVLYLETGTEPEVLANTLGSIQQQRYENWRLYVVADSGIEESIAALFSQLADPRISLHASDVRYLKSSVCSSVDYVAWLEAGAQLTSDALWHVIRALNARPDAELLYGDDDRIDNTGRRFDPRFKPAWNPDLLFSQDYIAGFSVFRMGRLRRIGWPRRGLEGAARHHDLILRFSRDLSAEEVVHIPQVLCHRWDDRRPAPNQGLAVVGEAARRRDPGAVVVAGRAEGSYHVQWSLPDPLPLVTLLVPTRDRVDILRPCVDAILAHTSYRHFELLILDNGSNCTEALRYVEEVRQRDGRVRVLAWNHPFNYSAINNFGARHARGSIIGLVNNDIEPINTDWMTEMVRQVSRQEIGCVGAKLYYPDERVQHAGVILGLSGIAGHAHKFYKRDDAGYCDRLQLVQNLSAVTAACLFIRKSVYDEVGGLNESDLPVAFNDVDLCLKVRRAGYRNLWTPYAELYHHESVSRGADDSRLKRERFLKEVEYMRNTWGDQLNQDPAYNPNLTQDYEDFSLRTLYR